jgi:hypothetical protein
MGLIDVQEGKWTEKRSLMSISNLTIPRREMMRVYISPTCKGTGSVGGRRRSKQEACQRAGSQMQRFAHKCLEDNGIFR